MRKRRTSLCGERINTISARYVQDFGGLSLILGLPTARSPFRSYKDGDDGDDGGDNGGTPPGNGGGTPPGNGGGTPPAGGGTPPGEDKGNKVVFTEEQQLAIGRMLSKEREEGKKLAEKAFTKQQADEKAAAEAAAAKEKGEFKTLAEKWEAEVTELKPKAEKADRLSVRFHTILDGEVKDWPASLKKQDPGKDADVEERAKWVENSRDLAKELLAGAKPPEGEHGSRGGGTGGGSKPTYKPTYYRPGAGSK